MLEDNLAAARGKPAIKLCGFTRLADVHAARQLAIDYMGFVFYAPSPRYIAPSHASGLVQALPASICPVGLFVNHSAAQVREAVAASGVRLLQFHGIESPDFCEAISQQLGLPYWKAVHVDAHAHSDALLKSWQSYSRAQAVLFDTASPALNNVWGGTGHTFEWQTLSPLTTRYGLKNVPPLVLSGGLSVQNVAQGIELLKPWALDLSSGIEAVDANGTALKGVKDPARMAAFVAAVRSI
jgi:phosphoribosylanthranilate isomerase